MKKLLSVVLAVVMCLGLMLPIASASEKELYPIIIVPGYSSSALCSYATGEQVHVWNIEIDKILSALKDNALELGIDLGALCTGDAKKLSDTVGREFTKMFGAMAYNEEGKPVDETLQPYYTTAEQTNTAWLDENEGGLYEHEIEIMPYVSQYLGDKAKEWTFNFNTDFRQNAVDCAADLDRYIDDILAYTGAEKVNILAVSHGGQISATYLSLYGGSKVNNAVLTVPAIGGALLMYDVFTNQIKLDEETLLLFIQNGMMFEEDYDWFVKANELGFLDEILYYFQPYIVELLGYWGSIWDFVPAEYFDDLSAEIDSEVFKNSEVYQKSVHFHEEILPNMSASLKSAEADGANIYLIAGTSWPSVVGTQVNSDAIISVNSSTGATVAPLGMRFSDGYQTLGTVCDNPEHNHLSPAMEIDASTCYLPDTTWFSRGLFHGMTLKDDYTARLMKTLVESEKHETVYTLTDFPQFHDNTNTCESVYCEFNNSLPSYLSSSDTALKITNLSKKYKMQIIGIDVKGADISFSVKDYITKTLSAGETTEISFEGTIPEESLTTMQVTVSYFLIGSITPLNERTQFFGIDNGEAVKYDANNPYTVLETENSFRTHLSDTKVLGILDKYGISSLLAVIYRIIENLLREYIMPLAEVTSKL